MKTHREAIEALGFEMNNKTRSWNHPSVDGIIVRFKGVDETRITSRVGNATLSGSVPAFAVNNLVASMLLELTS